jgi:hypothetical protein
MIECFKTGLFIQGIMHDMSKFLPREFFAYAKYFYGKDKERAKAAFERAWSKHYNINKHHWEYWLCDFEDVFNDCKIEKIPLHMPSKYIIEMVCDWVGAGRAQGFRSPKNDPMKETRAWYSANRDKITVSESTRQKIEEIIQFAENA